MKTITLLLFAFVLADGSDPMPLCRPTPTNPCRPKAQRVCRADMDGEVQGFLWANWKDWYWDECA